MNLFRNIYNLLNEIGSNQITSSPYDTAWVARLVKLGEPLGDQAMDWLRANQLADGSWGAEIPHYHHDRAVCTLAAMVAIAKYGNDDDRVRLQRGKTALETSINGLGNDLTGYTVGFEMVFPTLLSEAQELGIIQYRNNAFLNKLVQQRMTKLTIFPRKINRFVTAAFSVEMVGENDLHLLDVENIQQANGSVSYSPAATSFFVLNVSQREPMALAYLQKASVNGAVPYVTPIETFEYTWPLWNLGLTTNIDNEELLSICDKYLAFLEAEWKLGEGIASCAGLTLRDGDATSLTYQVLNHFNRSADIEAVLSYEEDERFRCFEFEANPSVSTNAHVLGALRQSGLEIRHPSVQKVLNFLQKEKIKRSFWMDKWHTSPYYPSSHMVIACAGYFNEFVQNTIDWMLSMQNPDGSWGYYAPTAEETAYCLQALTIWRQRGNHVPDEVLKRGAAWLVGRLEPPYPPLWIGKCLYAPVLVVRSAILSALVLAEQESS